MEPPEEDSKYLRRAGVALILEDLLAQTLKAKPKNLLSFLVDWVNADPQMPNVRDRLFEDDLREIRLRVAEAFQGTRIQKLRGIPYAAFPFTDFTSAIDASFYEDSADYLAYKAPLENCDLIVGYAARGAGPLVHALSTRVNKPYSLCNWYPAAIQGDLKLNLKSGGFAEGGAVYLNSIPKGARVVYVDDILRTGTVVLAVLEALRDAGAIPVACVFLGETSSFEGRESIKKFNPSIQVMSIVVYSMDGSHTTLLEPKLPKVSWNAMESPRPSPRAERPPPLKLTDHDYKAKIDRIKSTFVGIPIQLAPSGYPYSCFSLTDCVPALTPGLVDDIAACVVSRVDVSDVDVIVSESDRGSGPMVHAISLRYRVPYCLAGWDAPESALGVSSDATIGYSGYGQIMLKGLEPGQRCLVVDDVLSSGSTVEALFDCIQQAGGVIAAAVFASEKVNLNGRQRLTTIFPEVPLFSLCRFKSEGNVTVEA